MVKEGSADLWAPKRQAARDAVLPLAVRMRPRTLAEVAGQEHILAPGKLLPRMLEADRLTSIILHGPPGTGKTTLAEVIANHTGSRFVRENAASVGVSRIREIIAEADRALTGVPRRRTTLFLDEIHRFSKSQQDVLLADVERGVVTLIGATTENPLFAVNSALVSRSTLFRLEPLDEDAIKRVVRRALADKDHGFGTREITIDDEALEVWARVSDGDARRALTALEVAVLSSSQDERAKVRITRGLAEESIQQKAAVYDAGDAHYDAASAMIKSVRGSDPDAAVYWIAYMLDAGEDPRFIARRLAVLASEDIGNADPRGIMVAAAAWELCERLGMPECRITLSQCAIYLALAPKSNASYTAINDAMEDVKNGRTQPVPAHIKDTNVRKSASLSADTPDRIAGGDPYSYTHAHGIKTSAQGVGVVGTQDYLTVRREYYKPTDHGVEKLLKERLEEIKRLRRSRA